MIEETLNNLKLINQLEILIPIAILSVILVAISKSGFGGALGSLGLPVMVLAFPPKLAIAILLPLYLITDICCEQVIIVQFGLVKKTPYNSSKLGIFIIFLIKRLG